MSVGKRYVLDANVFIGAHQAHYGFDLCPGFWLALLRQHDSKRVCSIDRIRGELVAGHDDLSEWVKEKAPKTFFKQTADANVVKAFRDMVNWVQNERQFNDEAKAEFASVADGWVVAYAKANGLVVVSHEEYAAEAKRRVPIPNVCLEFGVEYCNTFDMLRDLKVQFILRKKRRSMP
ncbi:MAG: DUF4411 family protein [Planctomycetales bacterium]